jgi:hypothetical protein
MKFVAQPSRKILFCLDLLCNTSIQYFTAPWVETGITVPLWVKPSYGTKVAQIFGISFPAELFLIIPLYSLPVCPFFILKLN